MWSERFSSIHMETWFILLHKFNYEILFYIPFPHTHTHTKKNILLKVFNISYLHMRRCVTGKQTLKSYRFSFMYCYVGWVAVYKFWFISNTIWKRLYCHLIKIYLINMYTEMKAKLYQTNGYKWCLCRNKIWNEYTVYSVLKYYSINIHWNILHCKKRQFVLQ